MSLSNYCKTERRGSSQGNHCYCTGSGRTFLLSQTGTSSQLLETMVFSKAIERLVEITAGFFFFLYRMFVLIVPHQGMGI